MSLDLAGSISRVREGAVALSPREAARGFVDAYREHDLTVQASAIAFRLFLALVPCLLFLFGLLGFLGLDEVWHDDIAPELHSSVSNAAFTLLNDAVTNVLTGEQFFWVTIGALIATWQLSSIVRGSGHVLNRIYGVEEDDRPLGARLTSSYAVGAAVGILILAAVAVLRVGPAAADAVLPDGVVFAATGFVVRWTGGAVLLLAAIGLVVRAGPDVERPAHWVTFGALLVVLGWVAMSGLFGLYLTTIADYGSIFGNLATVFVLLEYLFLSANVFIGGLVLDHLVEEQA